MVAAAAAVTRSDGGGGREARMERRDEHETINKEPRAMCATAAATPTHRRTRTAELQ